MSTAESPAPPGGDEPAAAVTPMDRVRWSRLIAERRSERPRPRTWGRISKETGLSIDTCQRLLAQLQRSGDPDAPPLSWAWVYRRLDALAVTMDEAAATYAAAPAGSSSAVGALKLFDATSEKMLELAQRVGWTPRQLGALSAEAEMQDMLREMAAIAERFNAPDEMVRAFLDMAERRLIGRGAVVEASGTVTE